MEIVNTNNKYTVEIKIYENKIKVENFPYMYKGEEYDLTFVVNELRKDYYSSNAYAKMNWTLIKPYKSFLLLKNEKNELIKFSSISENHPLRFNFTNIGTKYTGKIKLQLVMYNKDGTLLDKTPIFEETIEESLNSDEPVIDDPVNLDYTYPKEIIDDKISQLYDIIEKLQMGEIAPPRFSIGTVTSLNKDDEPTVTMTGRYPNYVLNFGIPKCDCSGGGNTPVVTEECLLTDLNDITLLDSEGYYLVTAEKVDSPSQ